MYMLKRNHILTYIHTYFFVRALANALMIVRALLWLSLAENKKIKT